GNGRLVKATAGALALGGQSTFVGDIDVTGGILAALQIESLGSSAIAQTITLSNGGGFSAVDKMLSPNRRIVVAPTGGYLDGVTLATPGQLSGSGPLRAFGVELLAAN